jgi:predicted O-methyltransferase YrrM
MPGRSVDTVAAVVRDVVKGALVRAGRTRLGQHAIIAAVTRDPRLARLDTVESWPDRLEGFEDLSFLFASNRLNHGVISMQIDEAALLYRLAREAGAGATLVEIGRFKGGSTLLLAAARRPGAEVWSYDVSPSHDRSLADALRRYGLEEGMHVLVADSRTAEPPPRPCDVVFIDGDHSYEAVRADWDAWSGRVASGGHVLMHDAVDRGGFGAFCEGVTRLVAELEQDRGAGWERRPGAGALAHFARRS